MRKSDIARTIAEETDLTLVKAEDVVEAVLETMKETLSRGEPVMLRRFGPLRCTPKHAREGRNPKTGEPAEIAARRVVRFSPGRRLKRR